ncbi:Zinc finger protein LEE1 [Spathaspora sp. JA1]|nr:Zinc finger protein LEE1 [Spathaspora sp. JA1]
MNVNHIVPNSHPTTVKSHYSASTTATTTLNSSKDITKTPPQSNHNHYYNHNKHQEHYYSDTKTHSHSRSMTNSFDMSTIAADLPPNTGPPGTVSVTSPNGNGSSATANGSTTNKNLSHVPCKFFKQGICQAGNSCPFSHNLDGSLAADKLPCKYFQKGNCKFGLKCALAHFLPDGTRVNSKNLLNYSNGQYNNNNNNNGNGSSHARPTRRSSSFNFNFNSNSHQGTTVLESNDSLTSFSNQHNENSPPNRQSSNSGNLATFINIGNQQQHQPLKAHQASPSQQQPISLQPPQNFFPQSNQFMNRSSSFGSQESNYFPSHSRQSSQSQFQFSNTATATTMSQPPPQQFQNQIQLSHSLQNQSSQQQPFLFGSNSYSGAFGPTTSSMSTNSTAVRSYSTDYPHTVTNTSPSQTMYGNPFPNGPPSASSTNTTRYSLGSRLTTPSSTSGTSYFFQDTSSAIVDDDYDDEGQDLSKYEEDYVPQSLSDVILTPQELQRRDSRSQSGTLSVRPKLNTLVGSGNLNDGIGGITLDNSGSRNNFHRDPFKKDLNKIGSLHEDVFLME